MAAPVLLDTGPLVALLDRNDRWHSWASTQLEYLTEPMITCEAVLSESAFLTAPFDPGNQRLFALLKTEVICVDFSLGSELGYLASLLNKYRNLPMSLADACLVRMVERHQASRVFTIDSDFKIYRKNNRHVIPLIYPES